MGGIKMEQDNVSELLNKFNQIMENGDIPDNIKNLFNNSQQNSNDSSYSNNSGTSSEDNSHDNNNGFNLDFETIMKLQQIMNQMKNEKNDPRTNLLLSLKPYLKDSRKQKIEQYINIFKITKIIDLFNKTGGENLK